MKIILVVFVAIVAVIAAGLHFHFNAILPIFLILGLGLYWLTRTASPWPKGSFVAWGAGHGVYWRSRDYVRDDDPESGEDPRESDGFR